MGLCRIEDEFTIEKPRWVVTLSNGETILQDDDRPGEIKQSAWLRLKEYILAGKLSIVDYKLQFCSHIEQAAPPNKEGYFFMQKVGAVLSDTSRLTYLFYITGYYESKTKLVYSQTWLIPEIIPIEQAERKENFDSPGLIVNP
jgi:hypothetical protein